MIEIQNQRDAHGPRRRIRSGCPLCRHAFGHKYRAAPAHPAPAACGAPEGLFVGDIAAELQIANSTLSHHLDKLKGESLVTVQRQGTFLRYSANTQALQELLGFLYAECCTRNKAIAPQDIVCCK
jgi:DNA-binding transcriptional ArsR family regulator